MMLQLSGSVINGSRHTERNRRFDANGCDTHLKRYCLCGGNDKEHFQFDFMTYIYILVTILHLQWSRPCLRRRLWVQRWQRGQRRAWASGVWARRTWAKSRRRSSSLRSTLKVHRAAAARHVLCAFRSSCVKHKDVSAFVLCRKWVSVRSVEEGGAEVHELGDDGAGR